MVDSNGVPNETLSQERALFLSTAAACVDLISDPFVGTAWQRPSVLPQLSVGALAGHLSRGFLQVEKFLDADAPDVALITAPQYYAPFTDSADLSSERNRAVQDRGAERAELGQAAMVDEARACLERLQQRLPGVPADRTVEATGSSGIRGRVMLLDEYLKVRLVEQTIHYDDLVRSASGAASAPLVQAAYESAIGTLVAAAVQRHGPLAVLHALARRERDVAEALRVL